jgi:predicted ATPase
MQPPTGTVALVFTDVEGSTALWEHRPEAMRAGLALHDQLMRERLADHHGYEVKTEGDAFMVSFARPQDAVAWCLDVQARLPELDWPEELVADPRAAEVRGEGGALLFRGLRVRMGGHLGAPECKPDPVTGRMDYFGPVVNRAARVGGAGHGGQVVFSEGLWRAGQGAAGDAVATELGLHGMKGLAEPERLVQVLPASLAARRFPPLKTNDPRRTNLREPSRPLVGRARELAALEEALTGSRLVTLVAAGGTGKTRLAEEVGRRQVATEGAPTGGVWFADLTSARDAGDIAQTTAEALDMTLSEGDGPEAVGRSLAGRGELLLILDNFEQVVDHAEATVGRWLEEAPALRLLVTSREVLRLRLETRQDLAPLPADDAVELFEARATAASPRFELDPVRADVEALVAALDGLPLAIELAAARVRLVPVPRLRERLAKSLDALASRQRDVPARQRTLRATLDWSWDLLEPEEQRALGRLGVFVGGFFLEHGEELLEDLERDPLDLIEALQDKSLLVLDHLGEAADEPRFRLLVTVREYAQEKLEASGEAPAIRRRHADVYAAHTVREAGGDLDRTRLDIPGVARLARDRENLDTAFEYLGGEDPDAAARLALGYGALLHLHGPASRHLEVLAAARAFAVDPNLRGCMHRDLAELYHHRADVDGCFPECAEALDQAEATGDRILRGEVLTIRGSVRVYAGDGEAGHADMAEALAIAEEAGEVALRARALSALGSSTTMACDWPRAREIWERCVTDYRALGNHRLLAYPLLNLGFVRWQLGDGDAAWSCYDRALAYYQEAGDRGGEAMALQWIGELALALGDLERADEASQEGMDIARETLHESTENGCRFNLAVIAMEQGDAALAEARLGQAMEAAERNQAHLVLGCMRFYAGRLHAAAGRLEEAAEQFAAAREAVPEPFITSQGMDLQELALDLARARAGDGDGAALLAKVRARLAEVVDPGAPDPVVVDLTRGDAEAIENMRAVFRDIRRDLERTQASGGSGDSGSRQGEDSRPGRPEGDP